jgi:hypothetical protein
MPGWDIEYSTPKSVSIMVLSDDDIPAVVTDRSEEGCFGQWLKGHIAKKKEVKPDTVRFFRMRHVA